jgi:hypothetical protein
MKKKELKAKITYLEAMYDKVMEQRNMLLENDPKDKAVIDDLRAGYLMGLHIERQMGNMLLGMGENDD